MSGFVLEDFANKVIEFFSSQKSVEEEQAHSEVVLHFLQRSLLKPCSALDLIKRIFKDAEDRCTDSGSDFEIGESEAKHILALLHTKFMFDDIRFNTMIDILDSVTLVDSNGDSLLVAMVQTDPYRASDIFERINNGQLAVEALMDKNQNGNAAIHRFLETGRFDVEDMPQFVQLAKSYPKILEVKDENDRTLTERLLFEPTYDVGISLFHAFQEEAKRQGFNDYDIPTADKYDQARIERSNKMIEMVNEAADSKISLKELDAALNTQASQNEYISTGIMETYVKPAFAVILSYVSRIQQMFKEKEINAAYQTSDVDSTGRVSASLRPLVADFEREIAELERKKTQDALDRVAGRDDR